MNKAKTLVLLAALLPVIACAQRSVDRRLYDQHERIVQGVCDGQLTRGEALSLDRREAVLRAETRVDRVFDGGRLTCVERRGLERQLNRDSRAIYWDKHNAWRRY